MRGSIVGIQNMLTNFFKKDRAFSYARLFFILGICLLFVVASFGIYTVSRMQTVKHNQQASSDFFQKHQTIFLQYNNKRSEYLERYGKPTSTAVDTNNKVVVDTYLSKDASKGITIRYQMINDVQNDSLLVGYLINGEVLLDSAEQISFLKDAKGKQLSEIQKQCGVGKVLIESDDEQIYTITYTTNDDFIKLKIDKKLNQVSDVSFEKIKNNKK